MMICTITTVQVQFVLDKFYHLDAAVEAIGSPPASATFLRFVFSTLIVSRTEGLKMVCVTLQNLL